MAREYGFALIGCGGISKTHIQEIRNLAHGRLVAVSDISEYTARTVGEAEGVAWYTNVQSLLERDDVDIVNIVTPSGTHADLITAAANQGKHIVVEKPLDIALDKAENAVARCREVGVKLAVISQHRFDEATQCVKDAIVTGQFGRLFHGIVTVHWYRAQSYYTRSPSAGTLAMDGGGVFMIQAYHMIDVLQDLMGTVKRVYASAKLATHMGIEVDDSAVATWEFANGAIATISATTSAYPGLQTRLEVFGETGTAVIEGDRLTHFYLKNQAESEQMFGGDVPNMAETLQEPDSLALQRGYAHRKQFEDLLSAIEDDRDPIVSGKDGLQTLRLILAMYESANLARPVDIPAFADRV